MNSSNRSRKLIYAFGALAGFLIATAHVLYAVYTSTNSTAPIGLFLIPFYGTIAALIGAAVVYAGYTIADVLAGRLLWNSPNALAAWALVAIVLLFGGSVLLYRDAQAVASDPQSSPEALLAVSQRWLPLWREDVVFALAQNPSTPAVLLSAMAEQDGSHRLLSLVGANPGTPLAALEKIAAGLRNYERVAGLAENPRITPAIVERLANVQRGDFRDDLDYSLYQTFVLAALARNPATPQPAFDRLAARDRPEYFLAAAIIYADRSTCAQIEQAGGTDNEMLRSTARSQMRKRGC